MMKNIFALAAVTVLAATPVAFAGNGNGNNGNGNGNIPTQSVAGISGAFEGSARSISSGGSLAISGGIAYGGSEGTSTVRQENSAGNLSGAHANFTSNIGKSENEREISGTLVTETFTDGFSESTSILKNTGSNTAGVGAGFSTNWGEAEASGNFSGMSARAEGKWN